MTPSISEIFSTGRKAARGVGLGWGHADEAGRAASWLWYHGVDGIGALAHLLAEHDTRDVADHCPLGLGTRICDLPPETSVDIRDVISPILLLSFAAELVLDDVYELDRAAEPLRLSLLTLPGDQLQLAEDTGVGSPGADLHLDSLLTLMSPDGQTQEALLLVEVDGQGHAAEVYLLPMGPLTPQTGYRIVGIDSQTAQQKFGQLACVSFTRGTHISLSTGELRRIEDLRIGDRILTRYYGVQALRWIAAEASTISRFSSCSVTLSLSRPTTGTWLKIAPLGFQHFVQPQTWLCAVCASTVTTT